MKIIVFSDSHGELNAMIYTLESEKPDMVIHLGDLLNDSIELKNMFPEISFELIKGNYPFYNKEQFKSEKTFEIDNIKFFITHGHKYSVKHSLDILVQKGMNENADIILFGHTHISYINNKNGVWVINPGSINTQYTRDRFSSYAKILIENNEVTCEIIRM